MDLFKQRVPVQKSRVSYYGLINTTNGDRFWRRRGSFPGWFSQAVKLPPERIYLLLLQHLLKGWLPWMEYVIVHHKSIALLKRFFGEQVDDVCEQVWLRLSAHIHSMLVGRKQDGSSWPCRIIDIDPIFQDSSQNRHHCKVTGHVLKEGMDGYIGVWFE